MGSVNEYTIAFGLLRFLGFLIAVTMYQAGVALMAKKMGDHSYETVSRATVNPIPHIDILGTIILPFFTILMNSPIIIGWPKILNIEPRFFTHPKRDINIVYGVGVGINFLIAIICMIALRFIGGPILIAGAQLDFRELDLLIKYMVSMIGLSNMIFGALFLLPLPGLAGWHILLNNVSYSMGQKLQEKAQIIQWVGLIAIVFGFLSFYFNFFVNLYIWGSSSMSGI